MGSQLLQLVVLLLATAAAAARTIGGGGSRSAARLLQQVNLRCPAGCAADGCVLDSTSGGYRCTRCQGSLVVSMTDGTCVCPAGRYADTNTVTCLDCDKGSWCAGGTYTGPGVPAKTPCETDLTTVGRRCTSIKMCVNVPGTFYQLDVSGRPVAVTCGANSYGPGLRKQRACVPCAPGYTTNGATGRTSVSACLVPEGYYLKGPGQVAPCPNGEYKTGFAPAPSCTKCATGVSTPTEASIAEANCTVVLPTYYPSSIVSNIVKATVKCPQSFYCPGGSPTAAFSPSSPDAVNGTTVVQCASGTWTQGIGSTSPDQCMTPPGYMTTNGTTTPCADGEFRPEWAPAGQASSCQRCGDNISSYPTDQIMQYAITADAAPSSIFVRASAGACYIKPGQGMYYSPASNAYRAVNCESNNYGVANVTFGLGAYPCRDCPTGMQTSVSLPNSNAYYFAGGDGVQGFISPMACVTKAGFGYNGRVANKCPAGQYNAAGNYGTCTQCPAGLSTPDNATLQVAQSNCAVAIGYGVYGGAVVPCPVGTYNDVLRSNATAACTPCDTGLSTSQPGAQSCDVCAEGWGGPGSGSSCDTQCGGSNGANFGPAGRDAGQPCTACPASAGTSSFDFLAVNQPYAPDTVARAGASAPAACLAQFQQIADGAWFLGGSVSLTNVTASAGVDNFTACVADCKQDAACQYMTFDYSAQQCFKKVAGNGSDILGFKAAVAGQGGAYSLNRTRSSKGKALASGSYTFWLDDSTGVGLSRSIVNGISSFQDCLSACDQDGACAAVVMTGMASAASVPSSCYKVAGNSTINVFWRSMTKTVVTRLLLQDVL